MSMGARVWGGLLGVFALPLSLVAAPRPARADAGVVVAAALRGQVIVSDVLIAPATDLGSSAASRAALRRVGRPVVAATAGFWRFHFVAFLRAPAPASGTLQVVASDVTDPGPPRPVTRFELS